MIESWGGDHKMPGKNNLCKRKSEQDGESETRLVNMISVRAVAHHVLNFFAVITGSTGVQCLFVVYLAAYC